MRRNTAIDTKKKNQEIDDTFSELKEESKYMPCSVGHLSPTKSPAFKN